MAVADLPTYGYRRVWALLRRESERDGLPVVNAKRVYRKRKANAVCNTCSLQTKLELLLN